MVEEFIYFRMISQKNIFRYTKARNHLKSQLWFVPNEIIKKDSLDELYDEGREKVDKLSLSFFLRISGVLFIYSLHKFIKAILK